MGASITLAGESLIAQKQAANAGLKVSRFIFANVPGLNPNAPVDRAAPKPAVGQIAYVHDIAVEHAGYVNPNQVVYSAQIGSDVGDWDFNWIGLETSEGVLFAVAYVPVQQKRRNVPPLQIGNNLTRNFLVAFDGALDLTEITIDASTWQHDFTARLAGIDERERLSNRDVYGRACFFGGSLQLEKVGGAYQLKPGTAYIEGIRLVQSAVLPVVPPALPAKAWLDVVLQRELSDVVAIWAVVFGAEKADYTDALGVKHYCVAIADLTAAGVTDRRPVEAITGPLVQQFALRTGDYEQLRARATTKDDVKLGNLPNAISDDPDTNSSVILATTKAIKVAASVIWSAIANIVSGVTVVGKSAKLATARKITVSGAVNGSVDFDGSVDVTLNVAANPASEGMAGASKIATQAHVNEGVDDAAYVTSKKLRWGFAVNLAPSGYIVFPTWMGGLVMQWGNYHLTANGKTYLFPIAFPTACLALNISTGEDVNGTPEVLNVVPGSTTRTGFISNATVAAVYPFIAIGY
ncbi:phage tail protein [Pseudomonas lundensis]|uniref:phage tail-collar fiber domain-containing protein n=1 Tax=Pseudomonas lundensis TaxID=86185 RepID=UPI001472F9F9|nr:phage tail protein [Pseudomonas lundensis]NNA09218.1 phage tail protein [Pseudomonas lundensis]